MARTLSAPASHQDRTLSRADRAALAAERAVRRAWLGLLRAARAGGPWPVAFAAARAALAELPTGLHAVGAELARLHRGAAGDAANLLARGLPAAARRRVLKGAVREDAGDALRLVVAALLPPLDPVAVGRVVYASGWPATVARLTALAAPDALAARLAGLVQQGLTVRQIATQLRPALQNVQVSARRVARTAGLWVAHRAERDVYRGLEGDLILGYTVRAVLDARTRPEHRARNGQQFWVRPGPGQRPLSECPQPPREADGTWAFNCRCRLDPIISTGG